MDSIKQIKKLKDEFHENINSHVFLLETNNLDLCLKDVKDIIKEKIDADPITSAQIEEETYLELIVVRPEDKEIKKDQILALQERLKTKPILSDYLFYIIIPAEALSEISSNKLLKTIEEPNENIVAFLLTRNSDLILSTIKSRCEHLNIIYENSIENEDEIDSDLLETIKNLIYAIEQKDHIELTNQKTKGKIKDNRKTVEKIMKDYYNTACGISNYDYLDQKLIIFLQENNTYPVLVKKAKYLNKTFNKLIDNMNLDLLLEKMYFELKEV